MVTSDQTPLLLDTVDGAVDFKGRPVLRSRSGGWRAAAFIIGVDVAERFAYYGIGTNLINYLTGPLGESTIMAAQNVNLYVGVSSLLPLLGAFLADSFLGRYHTIIYASLVYILALGLMTLSATPVVSSLKWKEISFFLSLYVAALAQGGHKPCIEAFGADQFDRENAEENKARSSFFNWWYFSFNAGLLVTVFILNYIQDNRGWVLGYGIPCIAMLFALLLFLFGTWNYRFNIPRDHEITPFFRIAKVFMLALRNNWPSNTASPLASEEDDAPGALPHNGSQQFRFLNKALVSSNGSKEDGKGCSVNEVEEAKAVLRLVPIWAANLIYAIIIAQVATFFTKQGVTLDRKILLGFTIPSASLQTFIILTIVLLVPIYDRIIVPIARSFTANPSGITMLQRIGTGIFLSATAMVVAVLVETKRLKTARDYGLIDMPNVTIPMSIWWLIPQYVLLGVSDVFTMVGLQEFFYDQVPDELRSVGIALYISIFGVGSFLSSFLISVIQKVTGGGGDDGWFNTNLNRARLDCFYAVLVALNVLGLFAFLYFSKSYVYKRART